MNSASSNNAAAPHAALKTMLALAVVLIAGMVALHEATDGFRVVTTEEARRLAVAEQPRRLPDARIQPAAGGDMPLLQSLRDDGRVAIVAFIYTRCNTVCAVTGNEFQQLQERMHARGLDRRIRLLSISFDSADTPARLADYARRMHAHADRWQFAAIGDPRQRRALLEAFGITVIPAPPGEFQHNAAFHIVSPDGRLARIVDYEQPDTALAYALSLAQDTVAGNKPDVRKDRS